MSLWALLLSFSGPAVDEPEFRWLSEPELEAALHECGFTDFSIKYVDELQSDVVEFSDATVSEGELRCAFRAMNFTQYIPEWPAELSARYHQIEEDFFRPIFMARANAYFAQNPEFGEVPTRKTGETENAFGRRVVEFCDPQGEGFFVFEFGGLTVSDHFADQTDIEKRMTVLECVMNAAILSDLPFGFVGNDAIAE